MQHVVRLAGSRVPIRRTQGFLLSPPVLKRFFSTTACHSAKRYSDNHVWVELATNQKEATVGISEYAANSLGWIEDVQLPDVGIEVQQGSECGTVESVTNIYSPVNGTVLEKNEGVEDKVKFINESPLGYGWLFKVKLSDASEVDELMDEKAYQLYLKWSNRWNKFC